MSSEVRRFGVASKLLAKVVLEARLLGFTTIMLTTSEAQEKAMKFYHRMGFVAMRTKVISSPLVNILHGLHEVDMELDVWTTICKPQ